ncbi:MAG: PadR family transcriptional regulator, partial [Planctomycetota bacterium]
GTLYPILRRMEQQGLLESRWVTEQARPRKYYETTPDGRESLENLLKVWARVDDSLRSILALTGTGQPGAAAEESSPDAEPDPPPQEGAVDAE